MESQDRTQYDFLNDKDYYVVEFPDEVENGITAMAIVPYTWLITDKNNIVRCMWPTHIGSDKALTRAVMNKESAKQEKSKICNVTIKFKTNDYEKAVSRLKLGSTWLKVWNSNQVYHQLPQMKKEIIEEK